MEASNILSRADSRLTSSFIRTNKAVNCCEFQSLAFRAPSIRTSRVLQRVLVKAAVAEGVVTKKIDSQTQDALKRAVAKKVASLIKPGTIVGIGTGSTACMAIEELGKLKLKDVQVVVTSFQARVIARQNGVKTVDLNDVNHIDTAVDGADEVDANMNLIKGGGAAHTMEKVVNTLAKETIIIIDETKVVSKLGLAFSLPVEVLPPAITPVLRNLVALGGIPEIRDGVNKDGPVMSDLGNMIVDVRFPNGIDDPADMERAINNIPGVVENGLFVNVTQKVLVAVESDGPEIEVKELSEFVKKLKE